MNHPSLLAIETSVETGSVALWRNEKLVLERSFFAGRKPSGTLWPALQEVMPEEDALRHPLSAIVVGIGPGSYNGSRVGIAAAQGIALVHKCGIAPLCSFEGVSSASKEALAIGDARRGSFSLQPIAEGRLKGDFALVEEEELSEAIRAAHEKGQDIFSFDASERFPVSDKLKALIQQRQSQAGLLAKAFAQRSQEEQKELFKNAPEPFYLRDPHITVGKRKSLLER